MRFVIQQGDTLGRIARKYNLQVADLVNVNTEIKDADTIHHQQIIQLPNDVVTKYIVQPHDTLSGIASRFGTQWQDLLNHNQHITMSLNLDVGDLVQVPGFLVQHRLCDRGEFFVGYCEEFPGKLSQQQVVGIEFLLDKFAADQRVTSLRQIAYILATVKHETANTFQPIGEFGSFERFDRLYDPVRGKSARRRDQARRNGNTQEGDGRKYYGRGYVQLTWKNNYRNMSTVVGRDLVNHPERAKLPEIAYEILVYGMLNGIFTRRALGDYVDHEHVDYVNARRVVNGKDKAEEIGSIAEKFEKILMRSLLRHTLPQV